MKTEELTALGLTEDQVKGVFALNGVDIEKHKHEAATANQALEGVKTQLQAANTKLEGYDPEWKTTVTQAQLDAAKEVEKLKLDYSIGNALKESKAKDPDILKALIDLNAVKQVGDDVVGLKEQIEKLKTEKDYLFETEAKPPVFSLPTPGATDLPGSNKNDQANAAFRAAFGKE
jgi:hypothetical protein